MENKRIKRSIKTFHNLATSKSDIILVKNPHIEIIAKAALILQDFKVKEKKRRDVLLIDVLLMHTLENEGNSLSITMLYNIMNRNSVNYYRGRYYGSIKRLNELGFLKIEESGQYKYVSLTMSGKRLITQYENTLASRVA